MKHLIKDKKVLIIGLGQQGTKIIDFLLQQGLKANIIGVCQSEKTKGHISQMFNIRILLDYKYALRTYADKLGLICICVKPEKTQEDIYKHILYFSPDIPILIEKSFIKDTSLINILKEQEFPHGIIRGELLALQFFKEIQKLSPILRSELSQIVMKLSVHQDIFKNITQGNVFFLSYIFDYISFLSPQKIKLLYKKNLSQDHYKIVLDIDLCNIYIDFQRNDKKNVTDSTVIYKMGSGKQAAFNNNSLKSIIFDKYIYNYPSPTKNYFFVFLQEKITNLLQHRVSIAGEIEGVLQFRKLQKQCDQIFPF